MKTKSVNPFMLCITILFLLVTSCSKDETSDAPEGMPYGVNVSADGITDLAYNANIQADYGYFGTEDLLYFDINIHDYNPQHFSIGFIAPIPSTFNYNELIPLVEGATYPIGPNTLYPTESLAFQGIFESVNPETYESNWYDTSIQGGGELTIVKIIDNEFIDIEFNFIAYYYATLIESVPVHVAGNIRVKPREIIGD
ncbi:hypothetical protein [Winogradskyella pulchriflava]|uniref:Uncharacterized protein n=1 Tax=Winogradskyella pulchriflava TaxID=1110688 RepID=A0ABV6QBM3_9FLAO